MSEIYKFSNEDGTERCHFLKQVVFLIFKTYTLTEINNTCITTYII